MTFVLSLVTRLRATSQRRTFSHAFAIVLLAATPTLAQVSPNPVADEVERNAALEKTLTGATLVGHFTVTGGESGEPAQERYELQAVKHLEGEMWLITARIKYGDNDVSVPLPLPIRWAGDTPVITVDEIPVPGLGTFTARVMIYRDHYAGFWSGKDHGGHLFGIVERAQDAPAIGDDQTDAGN
jgi:hypothetical protein